MNVKSKQKNPAIHLKRVPFKTKYDLTEQVRRHCFIHYNRATYTRLDIGAIWSFTCM